MRESGSAVRVLADRTTAQARQVLDNPDLSAILVRHAYRGVRLQFLLRTLLLVFMLLTIVVVPPTKDRGAAFVVVAAYACWTGGLALWTRCGGLSVGCVGLSRVQLSRSCGTARSRGRWTASSMR